MVIYAINSREQGTVGIANYPNFSVPQGCVWGNPAVDDFSDTYEQLFSDAWESVGDAGWTVEQSGMPGDCNPCTGAVLNRRQFEDLGWTDTWSGYHLTRIRARFTPEQATEDLMLYPTNIYAPSVTAYADDYIYNYSCIDSFCDGSPTRPLPEPVALGEVVEEGKYACSGSGPAASGGLVAALITSVMARRRARGGATA